MDVIQNLLRIIRLIAKLHLLAKMVLFGIFLYACSSSDEWTEKKYRNQKGEFVYRKHNEILFIPPPELVPPFSYSWNKEQKSHLPKITKEYFRCKGSSKHSYRLEQKENEKEKIYDCGGTLKHSLPLREGKEYVYPILLELLNYIQDKTGKKIRITCGHRCPEHHRYADPAPENKFSKHMVGGEVAFYVQGMEYEPEKIVALIHQFYEEHSFYNGQKEFLVFKRYEKGDSNVAIQPWYNKEVYVKIYGKNEGRNLDNSHSYPYLSIQVRYDRDLDQKVIYDWNVAHKNYLRW